MAKGLILSFDFPPKNSIGAQRPYSWLKYFKKFGVNPIVITNNWANENADKPEVSSDENGTVIRVPFLPNLRDKLIDSSSGLAIFVRKILTVFIQFSQYFSFIGDNKRAIYYEAQLYLKKNKVDFIVATGEPYILYKYAYLLATEFNIPWVADYRDDWIGNYMRVEKAGIIDKVLIKFETLHEKHFLSNAIGFTGVSDFLVNTIQERTGIKTNKAIENGVELSLFSPQQEKKDVFSIVYTGIMYDMTYMQTFRDGFEQFIAEVENTKNIEVKFVGIKDYPNQATLVTEYLANKYPDLVFIEDKVPQQVAANYQQKASILLNLIAGDPSMGIIGAKCYNYAATRNPILSIPTIPNPNTLFFPNRNIQFIALSVDDVYTFIKQQYLLFCAGESTQTDITDEEIFMISREYKAKQLAEFILTEISKRK